MEWRPFCHCQPGNVVANARRQRFRGRLSDRIEFHFLETDVNRFIQAGARIELGESEGPGSGEGKWRRCPGEIAAPPSCSLNWRFSIRPDDRLRFLGLTGRL
jgi:hypothetical protein